MRIVTKDPAKKNKNIKDPKSFGHSAMVVYKQQPANYREVMIPGEAITSLKKV
jgi:hypothetical protein